MSGPKLPLYSVVTLFTASPSNHLVIQGYRVLGDDLIEVTQHFDCDLISEREMTLQEARDDYRDRLRGGWTKTAPSGT